jgi:isoleucyl-tRNA synthetase
MEIQFNDSHFSTCCRSIVQRYTAEWEKTVTRLGRWIDFKNDYKTMDPEYMESVWFVITKISLLRIPLEFAEARHLKDN